MNNKTLIAGLVGFFIGAVVIPDFGWLLGAVLGGCLGQLLHVSARLRELEHRFNSLANTSAQITQPRPTPAKPLAQLEPALAPEPVAALSPVATSVASSPVTAAPALPVAVPTAARSHAEPAESVRLPARPTLVERLRARVRDFFLQGNLIVRMGMVVMLFGLGFLVKYAAGAGLFPIQLRLVVIALIAVALLLIGWRTRHQQNRYGLVLQGGGVGALYLTIFAAAKFYALFPTGLAFALMLIVVTLGGLLAVLQNAQILAIMAAMGGFLAPVLLADGSGSHTMLFSFYLLLNLGVLGVALFKTWRWLNWLGFVFTFVISSVWGVLSYEPHLYGSTQPFLIAFFALYLCVSVLFSLKQPPQLRGLVDGSLIFGLPLVGFGLQAGLMNDSDYGLAVSAVVLSALYLLLAGALWKRYAAAQRLLIEAFIALGVGFATLAIPLALDADWTSAVWALEAAGLVWVGLRQQRLLPRLGGYGLYLAAVIALFADGAFEPGHTPIISGNFIGFTLLALAALMIAYLLHVYRTLATRQELSLQWLPIAAGLLWWLVAGINEIETHIPDTYVMAALLAFISLSLAASNAIANRWRWSTLARAGYSLLPLSILIALPFFLLWLFDTADWHPAANVGLLVLLIFATVQYRFLWQHRERGKPALLRAWHITSAWLWLALGCWEVAHWQRELGWQYAPIEMATAPSLLWFAAFAAPLILLMALVQRPHWPFTQYRSCYQQIVPAPALILLGYWFLLVCQYPGTTSFLHIPVLNPLDLAQLAVIVILVYAVKARLAGLAQVDAPLRHGGLAVLGFIWINALVLRAAHHYGSVPYERFALWNSATVQMALSIVWTLCALGMMVGSRRLRSRPMWMAGAGLLALVVIKLFSQDLSGSGTLPRVISFMAVGALMLIIGYLSPLPACQTRPSAEEATSAVASKPSSD